MGNEPAINPFLVGSGLYRRFNLGPLVLCLSGVSGMKVCEPFLAMDVQIQRTLRNLLHG
jgi:hypothetical protein